MLIFDFHSIGNKLHSIRKHYGLTQAEIAEAAGLSDRTYADIERGNVNMRIETILKICKVLHVTPNEILTEDETSTSIQEEEILAKLYACPPKERETAFQLLSVYLKSVEQ